MDLTMTHNITRAVHGCRHGLASAIAVIVLTMAPGVAPAGIFESHQEYIDVLTNSESVDMEDPVAVFRYVLNSSPATIHVQPTENYAYFKFFNGGIEWQGNMRLEIEKGMPDRLHFAYFVVPAPWHDEDLGTYKAFGVPDGLTITKNGQFDYSVEFDGTTRRFLLNDITANDMPAEMIGPGEVYLGQSNDESGLRLFLVFDTHALEFAYILDEQAPLLERLVPVRGADPHLLVGIRTGFAFLDEKALQRKRLIGVFEGNVTRNNYFDGPFDQLPDAWRGKMTVREAFAMIDPAIAEEIDEFGNFLDQDGARIIIAPYIRYLFTYEFDTVTECLRFPVTDIRYRVCLRTAVE